MPEEKSDRYVWDDLDSKADERWAERMDKEFGPVGKTEEEH